MDIENIQLKHALPRVFTDRNTITSEVWHQELTLHRGKRYLIEAASGTGKSSLCSYLYGYRQDYEGIICFNDKNIRTLSVSEWATIRRRAFSILFQELRIFPELTAWENVMLKNRLTGYKGKNEIMNLFDEMGIADKRDVPARKLSYGQQQRMAFIRSLCQPFNFIFLDEPISHLDEANAAIMSRLLIQEADKQKAAIVVTSIGKHLNLEYDKVLKL